MISELEGKEEDYRRRHGGMSRAEELAADAAFETAEMDAYEALGPAPLLPDEEGEGFVVEVLCPENHSVPVNFECPHTCRPGACHGCPAVEGDAPA